MMFAYLCVDFIRRALFDQFTPATTRASVSKASTAPPPGVGGPRQFNGPLADMFDF